MSNRTYIKVCRYSTVQELIDICQKQNIDPSNVSLEIDIVEEYSSYTRSLSQNVEVRLCYENK